MFQKKVDDKMDEWISKENKEGILIEDALLYYTIIKKEKR